jgi:hypothetical protein
LLAWIFSITRRQASAHRQYWHYVGDLVQSPGRFTKRQFAYQ